MCSIHNSSIVEDNFDEPSLHVSSHAHISRRELRSLIFHLLYAAESHEYEESIEMIADNLSKGFIAHLSSDNETISIARKVITDRDSLDEIYKPLLTNWRFDRISIAIKLILRLAVWELTNTETNPKIIINEAVELAKLFAEEDAYRFINGILDSIANKTFKDTDLQTIDDEPSPAN